MLLELADMLRGQVSSLHLFQYVTFRTIMSALVPRWPVRAACWVQTVIRQSLAASVKGGPGNANSDGPQSHLSALRRADHRVARAYDPARVGHGFTVLWADLHKPPHVVEIRAGHRGWRSAPIGFYDDYR